MMFHGLQVSGVFANGNGADSLKSMAKSVIDSPGGKGFFWAERINMVPVMVSKTREPSYFIIIKVARRKLAILAKHTIVVENVLALKIEQPSSDGWDLTTRTTPLNQRFLRKTGRAEFWRRY
jgi:hypothetical protein